MKKINSLILFLTLSLAAISEAKNYLWAYKDKLKYGLTSAHQILKDTAQRRAQNSIINSLRKESLTPLEAFTIFPPDKLNTIFIENTYNFSTRQHFLKNYIRITAIQNVLLGKHSDTVLNDIIDDEINNIATQILNSYPEGSIKQAKAYYILKKAFNN
jgi:hypothetical protein